MKNLYPKNKGKVYPSPSSPSSLTPKPNPDSALSVLKFLPATILTLASILSLEDREVLAYLITTNPSSMIDEKKKKKCKKPNTPHKPPIFDCGCFECYTSYWFRWDSSPNRELIHQVIEAFEDHLSSGERGRNNSGRKRDKVFDKTPTKSKKKNSMKRAEPETLELAEKEEEVVVERCVAAENEAPAVVVVVEDEVVEERKEDWEEVAEMVAGNVSQSEEMVQVLGCCNNSHKGLVRKVLPDVMGLFNSRIWSLWSTNI